MILSSCNSDLDARPAADPLDDPWVDGIGTGDAELAVSAVPEPLPGLTPNASDPISAGTQQDAPPAATVLATPSNGEAEPTTATARTPAASRDSATAPAVAPEQPAANTPAVDGQPVDPAPATEPASSPSAEPAKPASPPPITSADFHGSYRYAGGNTQRDELTAAIEATVDQLPKALHGIARKRLTQANPVDSSLDIVIAGDNITTTFESGFDVTCVIDGATVNTTGIDGEKLKVRVRAKDSKLVQHMEGKDGARTIVYVLSADGKKLTVHHKITADRLPEPLTYRLSYSRK